MSAVTTTICDSFPDVEKKLIAKVFHFDVFQRVLKRVVAVVMTSDDHGARSACRTYIA